MTVRGFDEAGKSLVVLHFDNDSYFKAWADDGRRMSFGGDREGDCYWDEPKGL